MRSFISFLIIRLIYQVWDNNREINAKQCCIEKQSNYAHSYNYERMLF